MMYKQFKFYLGFFLSTLFFTTCAYSAQSTELSTLLNGVQTMRANFTQTVYDNHGKAVQTSFGKMSLQRPGKFRWDVTKPIPQLIIANDTKLWIYDPDLEQVTIRSLKAEAGEAPALLLSHTNTSLDKNYSVKPEETKQANTKRFVLTPRGQDNMFARIKMGFVGNQIQEMSLEDHLGHITRIQFQKIETNVNLPSSLFVFKAKSNIDVIDETRK